jgi:hypothetical protein
VFCVLGQRLFIINCDVNYETIINVVVQVSNLLKQYSVKVFWGQTYFCLITSVLIVFLTCRFVTCHCCDHLRKIRDEFSGNLACVIFCFKTFLTMLFLLFVKKQNTKV